MLVGCMGASFNAAQVLVGNNFWVMEGPAAGPFQACHKMWNAFFASGQHNHKQNLAFDTLDSHYRPLQP